MIRVLLPKEFIRTLLITSVLSVHNMAFSETANDNKVDVTKTKVNTTSTPASVATKKNTLPLSTPKENNLKDKKLSKAFDNFVPSEKISADNAVPFPVDI